MKTPADIAGLRIGVVGAGAIGSLVAGRMARAGLDVTLLARGNRLRHLRARDLRIAGSDMPVRITATPRLQAGGFDLILSAVKAPSLPALAATIGDALAPGGVFLPLANGIPWWYFHDGRACPPRVPAVDPEGAIAHHLGRRTVIGSVVFERASLDASGCVVPQGGAGFTLGPIMANTDAAVTRAQACLSHAGFGVTRSNDIRRDVWIKLALNLATNPLSVVSGATLEQMATDQHLRALVGQVLDETLSLARIVSAGPFPEAAELLDICARGGDFMTSMAQDYARGAPLELASIADATFEIASAHRFAMPGARAVAALAAHLSQSRRRAAGLVGEDRPNAALSPA